MNVYETLSESGSKWAERRALLDGSGALTYGELWREVEDLRTQLVRLGVGAGQGVGVLARNGRGFIIAALAASGCGAVVMPIYHQLKAGELAETLARAPLFAVIEDGACATPVDGIHHTLALRDGTRLRYTRLTGRGSGPMIPWLPDAAFVRYTSGTTGASKGVALTHAGLLERIEAANRGLGLTHEDVALCVLPMAFHFFVSVLLYLRVGATVALCSDLLAESILDGAEKSGATLFYGSPLHIRMLAAESTGRRLPASLRRVMSVSSRLAPQAAREFHERYGVPVAQGYGIIEVGLPIMNLDDAAAHPESIGRPVDGFEAAILDETMQPALEGETGQLALRGPGMFAGYMDPPLPLAEVLKDGWFLTGDLAHRDASGLITIDGRCKSVINVAGHKVFPEEVAAVLESHPRVMRVRVTTRPHPQFGEAVHAEVQLRDAGAPLNPEDLLSFCRRRISSYKVPSSVEFVGDLLVTPSGKVRHG